MVSSSLKFSSPRDVVILDGLLVKLFNMTSSMVGLSKKLSLALEGLFTSPYWFFTFCFFVVVVFVLFCFVLFCFLFFVFVLVLFVCFFLSNGTKTGLCISNSSAQIYATLLENKH